MGHWIDLTSADGFTLPAWEARPNAAPRGAVVVLQELFGVNALDGQAVLRDNLDPVHRRNPTPAIASARSTSSSSSLATASAMTLVASDFASSRL